MRRFVSTPGVILLLGLASAAFARDIKLKVLDTESLQPLSRASVIATLGTKQFAAISGSDGTCTLKLPELKVITRLSVKVTLQDYIPSIMEWKLTSGTLDEVPPDYTFYLEKGGAIGGTVVDEEGEPIHDVEIHIFARVERGARERTEAWDKRVYTTTKGTWEYESIPSEIKKIRLRLVHDDYVTNKYFDYGQGGKPIAGLFDKTDVIQLSMSLQVTGVVQDLKNNPIEGAKIWMGESAGWPKNAMQTTSEKDGEFKFKGCKLGETLFLVQAEGFAPDVKKMEISKEEKRVAFVLFPGEKLRGKVVDQGGLAVEGAKVEAVSWREGAALDFQAMTDKDGRFEWTGAPADEVKYDIGKQGFGRLSGHPLIASKEEILITLKGKLNFRGEVVDAETGKPIEKFKVVPGISWGGGPENPMQWERGNAVEGKSGAYTFGFPYYYSDNNNSSNPKMTRGIRIEADGYYAYASPPFSEEDGLQVFDVKLKKGKSPSGIVKSPGGKPVEGAAVVMALRGNYTMIENGVLQQNSNSLTATTDKDGRYSFSPQMEPFRIVALTNQGVGELRGDETTEVFDIELKPWGGLKGVLKQGAKPLPNEKIVFSGGTMFYDPKLPMVQFQSSGVTDAGGRFSFDRVIPGTGSVSQQIEMKDQPYRSFRSAKTETVTIESGKTAEVALGGKGRPVIGRVKIPAGSPATVDTTKINGNMSSIVEEIVAPEEVKKQGIEAYKKWQQEFYKTEAGRAQMAKRKHFGLEIKADGTWRAEEVVPGSYSLNFYLMNQTQTAQTVQGMAFRKIEVPAMPGGFSEEPLDLGEVELRMRKDLKEGDHAPLFKLKTLAGKPFDLAGLRGQYVLLHFWHPYMVEADKEWDTLKKIQSEFGKDKRFAMVGICYYVPVDFVEAALKGREIGWTQLIMPNLEREGDESGGAFSWLDYGMDQPPMSFLISPDGKFIALRLKGEAILAAVQKALGEAQSSPK